MLDLTELVRCVLIVSDTASVLPSVMHGEFLLQVTDFLLIAFDHQVLILEHIDTGFIRHAHHTGCEFECADGLLQVRHLRPDIRDHHCLAVATQGVPQQVSQL